MGSQEVSPYLVEEDVLAIPSLGRKVLEISILIDPVLLTQLLPELTAHYKKRVLVSQNALVPVVFYVAQMRGVLATVHRKSIPLLPHWPAWMVMISLHEGQFV